jgi:hypothetical protein
LGIEGLHETYLTGTLKRIAAFFMGFEASLPRDNTGVFGAKQAAALNRPFAEVQGWDGGCSTGRPHPETFPAVCGEGLKKFINLIPR